MATYSAEVAPLNLGVGLPPQVIREYKAAEAGTLALALGLNSIGLRLQKAALPSAIPLALGLQAVTLRKRGGVARPLPLALTVGLGAVRLRALGLRKYPEVQAPSDIQFTPPKFPLTKSRTQQGTSVTRIWASTPGDALLNLEYEVIDDASVELILKTWDSTRGTLDPIRFPASTFGGASNPLLVAMKLMKERLRWYFSERPQVRSLFGGFSSLSVTFKGVTDRIGLVFVDAGIADVQPLVLSFNFNTVRIIPVEVAAFQPLSLSLGLQTVTLSQARALLPSPLALDLELQPVIARTSNGIATVQPLTLTLAAQSVDLIAPSAQSDSLYLPDVFLDSVFLV